MDRLGVQAFRKASHVQVFMGYQVESGKEIDRELASKVKALIADSQVSQRHPDTSFGRKRFNSSLCAFAHPGGHVSRLWRSLDDHAVRDLDVSAWTDADKLDVSWRLFHVNPLVTLA